MAESESDITITTDNTYLTSNKVSIVRILETVDPIITTPHCIYSTNDSVVVYGLNNKRPAISPWHHLFEEFLKYAFIQLNRCRLNYSDFKRVSMHPHSSVHSMFVQKGFIHADIKRSLKARHHWPFCEGNPPVTGGFPSQRTSSAERASMSWFC